jgi:hypothetical protein
VKEFIPQINIKPDRLYLTLRQKHKGYATRGSLYCHDSNCRHISVPITKRLDINYNYVSELFNTINDWNDAVYRQHSICVQGTFKIYEFKTFKAVERFLKKLKLAEKLVK